MTRFRTKPNGRVYPLSETRRAPARGQMWMNELYDDPEVQKGQPGQKQQTLDDERDPDGATQDTEERRQG